MDLHRRHGPCQHVVDGLRMPNEATFISMHCNMAGSVSAVHSISCVLRPGQHKLHIIGGLAVLPDHIRHLPLIHVLHAEHRRIANYMVFEVRQGDVDRGSQFSKPVPLAGVVCAGGAAIVKVDIRHVTKLLMLCILEYIYSIIYVILVIVMYIYICVYMYIYICI